MALYGFIFVRSSTEEGTQQQKSGLPKACCFSTEPVLSLVARKFPEKCVCFSAPFLLHKNFPLPFPDRVRPDWLFFKTSTIQLTTCVFHTYYV